MQRSVASHQGRYQADRTLVTGGVLRDLRPEWQITALFYSALHLVEARLCHLGHATTSGGHKTRRASISRWVPEVRDEFQDLYDLSMKARYSPWDPLTKEDFDDAQNYYNHVVTEMARYGLMRRPPDVTVAELHPKSMTPIVVVTPTPPVSVVGDTGAAET